MLLLLTLMALTASPDTTRATLPYYPDAIRYAEVEGHRLAYYDSGATGEDTGKPPLLFVHGLGSNLSFWRYNLNAFTARHRVLALDLPGYGLSDKADVDGTMRAFSRAVAGFMDALGIEQAHVVGVSMGGQVAMTLALAAPDRVASLALVSPAGIEQFDAAQATMLKTLFTPEAIQGTPPAMYRQNVMLNFATWDETYAWIIEQRRAQEQRADFPEYATVNAASVAGMLDGPVYDRLGELEMPVLVIYGRGDKLIPNRYLHPEWTTEQVAMAAAEAMPHARIVLLERAGHVLMIERPAAFNEHLRAFLESAMR